MLTLMMFVKIHRVVVQILIFDVLFINNIILLIFACNP